MTAQLKAVELMLAQGIVWKGSATPPPDTASTTFDASVTVDVDGSFRIDWLERPKTTAEANTATLQSSIQTAMAQLQSYIDQAPVTVTTIAQAQTVCRALQQAVQFEAQVLRRLIRLVGDHLDDVT